MSNIEKRVNELKEKDRIKKELELKQVYEFWDLIKEDLMVAIIYNVDKDGELRIYSQYGSVSDLLQGVIINTKTICDNEIAYENVSQVLVFSCFQQTELRGLILGELAKNKFEVCQDGFYSTFTKIKRMSKKEEKPVAEFKKPVAVTEAPSMVSILFGLILILAVALIGSMISC